MRRAVAGIVQVSMRTSELHSGDTGTDETDIVQRADDRLEATTFDAARGAAEVPALRKV